MKKITIETSTIRLDQFLKWAEMTDSGGQSKFIIKSGMVQVNRDVEMRRGRTLVHGDVVQVEGMEPVQVFNPSGEL